MTELGREDRGEASSVNKDAAERDLPAAQAFCAAVRGLLG